MRPILSFAAALLLAVPPLAGQEPEPPVQEETDEPARGAPWLRVGLLGFSARGGVDLEDDGQAVVGIGLDVGHLYSDRLRMRLSGEVSMLNTPNTYVANLELLYRFTPDTETAVPYVGAGVGLAGRDDCDLDPDCPALWAQFLLGFELVFTDRMSWLLEYHPEDALRRHRIFVGLTTRRGT